MDKKDPAISLVHQTNMWNKLPGIYYSTYRCKKKNGYNTHIYWVCSRFVTLQLSKITII